MMTATDWLLAAELVSGATVIVTTIYVMQRLLHTAHHLLRLGVALVCAGAALELYCVLQHDDHMNTDAELARAVLENVGQAAVYIWAASSRRLWALLDKLQQGK